MLLTTRGSSGHILPLAPFGHACLRAGHQVMVAAQRQHRSNVERAGLAFTPVDDPPKHEWMPLMVQFERLSVVARAGAGLALDAEHATRRVLELPGSDTISALAPAVTRLLDDPSYRRHAGRIADAADTLAPVDAAVGVLAAISRGHASERPVRAT